MARPLWAASPLRPQLQVLRRRLVLRCLAEGVIVPGRTEKVDFSQKKTTIKNRITKKTSRCWRVVFFLFFYCSFTWVWFSSLFFFFALVLFFVFFVKPYILCVAGVINQVTMKKWWKNAGGLHGKWWNTMVLAILAIQRWRNTENKLFLAPNWWAYAMKPTKIGNKRWVKTLSPFCEHRNSSPNMVPPHQVFLCIDFIIISIVDAEEKINPVCLFYHLA